MLKSHQGSGLESRPSKTREREAHQQLTDGDRLLQLTSRLVCRRQRHPQGLPPLQRACLVGALQLCLDSTQPQGACTCTTAATGGFRVWRHPHGLPLSVERRRLTFA